MTEQEALENLRNFLGNSPYQKEISIIEQALERSKQLEKELKEKLNLGNALCSGFSYNDKPLVLCTLEHYDDIMTENEKFKNVIEVLKKFNFRLGQKGNGEYYILIYYAGIDIEFIITQQVFDLLNEVLGE